MPELHFMDDDKKEATSLGQIKLKRVTVHQSLQHLLDDDQPGSTLPESSAHKTIESNRQEIC